jgi:hypothetical protein
MDIRDSILEFAVDDYVGLWELVWRARSVSGTESNDKSLRARVLAELKNLLSSGDVALYRGLTFNGDEALFTLQGALDHLDDDGNWLSPAPGVTHLRVGVKPSGERRYFKQSTYNRKK